MTHDGTAIWEKVSEETSSRTVAAVDGKIVIRDSGVTVIYPRQFCQQKLAKAIEEVEKWERYIMLLDSGLAVASEE